jgi:hypothetical protein
MERPCTLAGAESADPRKVDLEPGGLYFDFVADLQPLEGPYVHVHRIGRIVFCPRDLSLYRI